MQFPESLIEIPDNVQSKRILVTGGAGAIGSRLSKALAPHAEVVVLDDLSSGYAHNIPDGVRFVRGSITESRSLREAFEFSPELVFHLAANFANQNSVENPEKDLRVNGTGTIRVIQECIHHKVESLVYASSSCTYGRRPGDLEESQKTLQLDTPYAITKLLGEYYVNFYAHHEGIKACSIRYFNVYGPCELPGRYRNVIPNFIYKAKRGQPLTITGTGKETRDFTYVDDAISGTLQAASRGRAGEVYNIGTGEETTILELVGHVNSLTKNPAPVEYAPRRNWDSIDRRKASIERAREDLGYAPKTALTEGLSATCQWFEQNWEQIHGIVRL